MWTFRRFQGCFTILAVLTLVFLLPAFQVLADDEKEVADPYQEVWDSLSEVIARREYSSAISLLESAAEEPELKAYGRQIASDRTVLAGLQTFESYVKEAVAKLEEGNPIQISGADYSVICYDRDPQKEELVLMSKALRKEIRKPVVKLPSSNWIELAGPRMASQENTSLLLGVFVGFDQLSDAKLARKYFNDASSTGGDVKVWLTRLDALETQRKRIAASSTKTAAASDPIVGTWNMVVEDGKAFAIDIKKDGTTKVTLPPAAYAEMRKNRKPIPTAAQLTGKWTKDEEGVYRISYGHFTFVGILAGNRLLGKGPGGKKGHALREVK